VGRLIDPEEASLEDRRIGALPIVNAFVERLGLKEFLDSYVVGDPHGHLQSTRGIPSRSRAMSG